MNVLEEVLVSRGLSVHGEPVVNLNTPSFSLLSVHAYAKKNVFFLHVMGLCYYILVICIFNEYFTYIFSQIN